MDFAFDKNHIISRNNNSQTLDISPKISQPTTTFSHRSIHLQKKTKISQKDSVSGLWHANFSRNPFDPDTSSISRFWRAKIRKNGSKLTARDGRTDSGYGHPPDRRSRVFLNSPTRGDRSPTYHNTRVSNVRSLILHLFYFHWGFSNCGCDRRSVWRRMRNRMEWMVRVNDRSVWKCPCLFREWKRISILIIL